MLSELAIDLRNMHFFNIDMLAGASAGFCFPTAKGAINHTGTKKAIFFLFQLYISAEIESLKEVNIKHLSKHSLRHLYKKFLCYLQHVSLTRFVFTFGWITFVICGTRSHSKITFSTRLRIAKTSYSHCQRLPFCSKARKKEKKRRQSGRKINHL